MFLLCSRGGVDNDTCSGSSRGECDCTCMCIQPEIENQMIFGEACECDNFRCPGNPVCSGEDVVMVKCLTTLWLSLVSCNTVATTAIQSVSYH